MARNENRRTKTFGRWSPLEIECVALAAEINGTSETALVREAALWEAYDVLKKNGYRFSKDGPVHPDRPRRKRGKVKKNTLEMNPKSTAIEWLTGTA